MVAALGTATLLSREGLAHAADFQAQGAAVDVRNFGARGDGSSDDTAAINAAIDSVSGSGGGTVILPPGTYAVGGSDYVHLKSNITLQGSGPDATVIVAAPGSAPHHLAAEVEASSNITLEQLTFDGRGAATALVRLVRSGTSGVTIQNCRFQNVGAGKDHFGLVIAGAISGVNIRTTAFLNKGAVQGVGVTAFGGASDITIAESYFEGLYGGVRFDRYQGGCRNIAVTGSTLKNWNKWGILAEGADGVRITDNMLENSVGDADDAPFGISAQAGSKNVVIAGNTLTTAGEISSYNSQNVSIQDNTVIGATWAGIEINDNRQLTDGSDTVHVQILGNRVEGSARSGIFVSGEDVLIQDNLVFGNGGNGLTVAEGGKGIRVIGNTSRSNALSKADVSAIRIGYATDSADLNDVLVMQNVCFADDPRSGQQYGIHVEGPVRNCQITGNSLGDDDRSGVQIDTANFVSVDANLTTSALLLNARL
jgi:hypothetical protein